MKTLFKTSPKRGSALLIVLGFLSFMLISAVSFAIYMRIERQASSNYRHTITSRHMLNAALYRAIDEIDSDLRDTSVSASGSPEKKFPYHWKNRVRPSATDNSEENTQDARVLSLEALSFIPGILVNDVRRYAVRADADSAYMGAKWRKLSMPVRSLGDESGTAMSADGRAVIGRYAYVCVNVSDMLDANTCRASIRNANTNHVSIAHLFDSDTQRESYDDNYRTKDIRYETLQDFYACMSKLSSNPFESPYHLWMGKTGPTAGREFSTASKHVLITNSKVLSEPTNNASLNLYKLQPSQITDAFVQKLDEALKPAGTIPNTPASHTAVKAMLADYIDEDAKPTNLNIPSVEMVPMISQITFVPMGGAAAPIMSRDVEDTPGVTKKMYYVKVGTDGTPYGNLIVEAAWPFQNYQARKPTVDPNTFKVQVQAYVKISSLNGNRVHTTMEFMPRGGPVESDQYYKLSPTVGALNFKSNLTPDDQGAKINDFYCQVPINLGNFSKEVDIIDSKGNAQSIFQVNEYLSVALIVFVQILDSDGTVVDQAPKSFDGNAATVAPDEFTATQKIFFETGRQIITATMAAGNLAYQWTSLEVPDPRFNYKASNWVQWKANTIVSGSGSDDPQKPFINQSTCELLGKDGRDSDIFMSVADSGYFQSPGELGFIVRPFDFNIAGTPCDFSDTARTAEDAKYMFRTIRLYDHTQAYPKDNIYGCFTAMEAGGKVNGARVNPLSDIDKVLQAAIVKTPLDYWLSARMETETDVTKLKTYGKETYDSDQNPKKSERTIFTKTQWQTFADAWNEHFESARSTKVATSADGSKTINESWMTHLRDVYGLYNTFGWYADGDTMKIFKGSDKGELDLGFPLHEIDRKMLYSFSLDSFSDRQQLFLYFLRAEATPPGLGTSAATGGGQSLAGGRAVALVWRDPYPVNYNLENNTSDKKCSSYGPFDYDTSSPWSQYPDVRGTRDPHQHDHQILFFKTLGN